MTQLCYKTPGFFIKIKNYIILPGRYHDIAIKHFYRPQRNQTGVTGFQWYIAHVYPKIGQFQRRLQIRHGCLHVNNGHF